ncbi:hypothetical protein L1887_11555 [Cichorium endivia]|nr:hypothetical protein L1887_11555 [Cichorium endivia]
MVLRLHLHHRKIKSCSDHLPFHVHHHLPLQAPPPPPPKRLISPPPPPRRHPPPPPPPHSLPRPHPPKPPSPTGYFCGFESKLLKEAFPVIQALRRKVTYDPKHIPDTYGPAKIYAEITKGSFAISYRILIKRASSVST